MDYKGVLQPCTQEQVCGKQARVYGKWEQVCDILETVCDILEQVCDILEQVLVYGRLVLPSRIVDLM